MTARFIVNLADPDRFWKRVDRRGPDECWEWTGSRNEHGYGGFREDAPRLRLWGAHRVAFMLTSGEPLSGREHVCHHCDNPPCCNPTHLFLGDYASNTADKVAKGRQPRGERVSAYLRGRVPSGDDHWTRRNPERMWEVGFLEMGRVPWNKRDFATGHGSVSHYRQVKCRCEPCRAAWAAYQRAWRTSRKAG